MTNFFEGHGVTQVIPRAALSIMFQAAYSLEADLEMVIFPTVGSAGNPWICFNLGERRFGIWTHSMALYEADEHGAMGDEVLNPVTLAQTKPPRESG